LVGSGIVETLGGSAKAGISDNPVLSSAELRLAGVGVLSPSEVSSITFLARVQPIQFPNASSSGSMIGDFGNVIYLPIDVGLRIYHGVGKSGFVSGV
jgi:hypothetical protein